MNKPAKRIWGTSTRGPISMAFLMSPTSAPIATPIEFAANPRKNSSDHQTKKLPLKPMNQYTMRI